MAKVLVSNCLLGCNCRYKGDNCRHEQLIGLLKNHTVIGICPEQMGGLPTPRIPSEKVKDKFISSVGKDVTYEYHKGANMALDLAKENNIDFAILKSKSPSCGKGQIYDGTFSGILVDGNGITVDLLLENGFEVYSELELESIKKRLGD